MTAAVAELSSVMRKPEGSWTPDDLATFHAARAKMNDSLTSDLNSPLVAEWFSPSPRLGGWLTYGPAEIYLIAKGEPHRLAAGLTLDRFRTGRLIDEAAAAAVAH